MQEIEIKLKLPDANALMSKVESLGGKKLDERLDNDVMYDDGKGFFDAHKTLRLRRSSAGFNLLTYKAKIPGDDYQYLLQRTEIETKVDNAEAADQLLRKLGFVPYRIKEKKEVRYQLDDLVLQFHTMPFMGEYLEIEGEETQLRVIVQRLGLSFEQGINQDYTTLFHEYLRQHHLPLDTPQTFAAAQRLAGQE